MKRVLHSKEIEEYRAFDEEKRKGQYLASRWALKEAMVKASGNTSLYYPGMYLKKVEDKKPVMEIDSEFNYRILFKELEVSSIHSTLSHEDLFAVAFVILETLRPL